MTEGVPDTYQPRDDVLSMSVACGRWLNEGSVIRSFHKLRYGINSERIVTFGCDQQVVGQVMLLGYNSNGPFGEVEMGNCDSDYDAVFRGVMGDALTDFPWNKGLLHAGDSFLAYDFAHINYPDLLDMTSWILIAKRALFNLTEDGMLSVVSLDEDISKLKRLEEALGNEGEYKIFPVKDFRYVSDGGRGYSYGLLCAQRKQ